MQGRVFWVNFVPLTFAQTKSRGLSSSSIVAHLCRSRLEPEYGSCTPEDCLGVELFTHSAWILQFENRQPGNYYAFRYFDYMFLVGLGLANYQFLQSFALIIFLQEATLVIRLILLASKIIEARIEIFALIWWWLSLFTKTSRLVDSWIHGYSLHFIFRSYKALRDFSNLLFA